MPEYLTIGDFLANDSLMSKKISGLRDSVDAVREQLSSLTGAFKNYVSETDTYRIANNKRLDGIDTRLNSIETQLSDLRSDLNGFKQGVNSRFDTLEQTVDTLAQTVSQGFTLIFAHLGITPP